MKLTRRTLLGMAVAAAATAAAPGYRDQSVVLFTSDADPDMSLATIELRKLYLGFSVRHDGHVLRPIRNRSDATLDSIFLQNVVAMSENAYERRLLELSLQQGRPRPVEVFSLDALVRELKAAPHGISFGWQSDVERVPEANVIRTLWHA